MTIQSAKVLTLVLNKLLLFEIEDRERVPGRNTTLDTTKQDAMAGIVVAVKQHSAECKKLLRDDLNIKGPIVKLMG